MRLMPLEFEVDGAAKPAGSKRAFVLKKGGAYTGRAIVTDANPNSGEWKQTVKQAARTACATQGFTEILTCPVILYVNFFFIRPKSHYGTGRNASIRKDSAPEQHIQKPDLLKLARAIEDALTGVVWRDDSQIVSEILGKSWAPRSYTRIRVEPVEDVHIEPPNKSVPFPNTAS